MYVYMRTSIFVTSMSFVGMTFYLGVERDYSMRASAASGFSSRDQVLKLEMLIISPPSVPLTLTLQP